MHVLYKATAVGDSINIGNETKVDFSNNLLNQDVTFIKISLNNHNTQTFFRVPGSVNFKSLKNKFPRAELDKVLEELSCGTAEDGCKNLVRLLGGTYPGATLKGAELARLPKYSCKVMTTDEALAIKHYCGFNETQMRKLARAMTWTIKEKLFPTLREMQKINNPYLTQHVYHAYDDPNDENDENSFCFWVKDSTEVFTQRLRAVRDAQRTCPPGVTFCNSEHGCTQAETAYY